MKHAIFPSLLFFFSGVTPLIAQNDPIKPKLVINIVISQMRADYLNRFAPNFASEGGFHRFTEQGCVYTNAYHDYMQTNTAAGLATIATGTNPAGHGVISENWIDFTTSKEINLIDDSSVTGLECDAGTGCYSPRQLTAATLGDRLKASDAKAKVIAIAATPVSAIVSGGYSADTYWMDENRGPWISSTFYFKTLPGWVSAYNKQQNYLTFTERAWEPSKSAASYINTDRTVLDFNTEKRSGFKNFMQKIGGLFKRESTDLNVASLLYTPYGNTLTTQFAREAIIQEKLGSDTHTDLLTIVYDAPRLIGEHFGPQSIELEDMYYKLDLELGILTDFVLSQFKPGEVVLVLTSDHGTSDTFRAESRVPMGQFNVEQFKMILNGFLSAQFEPGNWVLGYHDRQVYLNRSIIYSYGFNLAEVQTRAAGFALQFRGVCGALTSTSLQNGSFGEGYAARMQNSFYPKRSGDLLLNLQPGWIEEQKNKVSLSGSMYDYDTHIPLILLGGGIPPAQVERPVRMMDLAPTLARIMQITVPNAATGTPLQEAITK